jgi:2-polyprenyl-3-methyl-5-hydroxy-6-metoxy-1,4-benzoquinol methylase
MIKNILNRILDSVGFIWNLLPQRLRIQFITVLLIIESRHWSAASGMRNMFAVEDKLNWIINERAMNYGNGIHPKHRLTKYFEYFLSKIELGDSVIDIGCSRGEVAKKIAEARPESNILGVDIEEYKILEASTNANLKNLKFLCADATKNIDENPFDVMIVSNVLEHINERTKFLKNLIRTTQAKKVLLRVPLFQREWQMPMRQELGINYFSDPDHEIEHTIEEFVTEVEQAGIKLEEVETLWGEIWAVGYVTQK